MHIQSDINLPLNRHKRLGTARRHETSQKARSGQAKLPQPTGSGESGTGVHYREPFRWKIKQSCDGRRQCLALQSFFHPSLLLKDIQ
jgi:hypothetical protein